MNEVKLLVGGGEIAARSGAVFERSNPGGHTPHFGILTRDDRSTL